MAPTPAPTDVAPAVTELIARSRALGADRRLTNYGGGNTSAKVTQPDPVSGEPTAVLVVKGSGGDLGTLTLKGLAQLSLDRVRALEGRYDDGVHEDDIVDLYTHCRFGDGGAVPSIDTPLHAFVDAVHVDHLHPDAVIALAAATDGKALVQAAYGDEIGWLDWQRPGFELGLALRAFQQSNPAARGAVLGGHGVIVWADTSAACQALSIHVAETAERYLVEHGRAEPFGPPVAERAALSPDQRAAEAARLGPVVRGLCGTDRPVVGCFDDDSEVLDFLASERSGELAALGTSCPDHFLRTKVRPLYLDVAPTAPFEARVARLRELHAAYRDDYRRYYEAHATPESPAMRNADPAIVLVPGVGMFSFGADSQTARVAGEFYRNAIAVMRGAEAVSSYAPISDAEKFRIEYWLLEERKLQLKPPAPPLTGRVALVTGAGSGIGRAVSERLHAAGAVVVLADLDRASVDAFAADLDDEDRVLAVDLDVTDEHAVAAAFATANRRFGGVDLVVNSAGMASSMPLVDTSVADWERLQAVLSRGSFLVSREAARTMVPQGLGGDIVYIVSKNAVVAGPDNVAYGSAKAGQAHQVRLVAAELGGHGIRVNGVNPDGVVQGSRIFSSGWGAERAQVYGVEETDLGRFYAQRTLLKTEVLPEHVAAGVYALVAGDLALTTGTIIPVDGGVPAAFLR